MDEWENSTESQCPTLASDTMAVLKAKFRAFFPLTLVDHKAPALEAVNLFFTLQVIASDAS